MQCRAQNHPSLDGTKGFAFAIVEDGRTRGSGVEASRKGRSEGWVGYQHNRQSSVSPATTVCFALGCTRAGCASGLSKPLTRFRPGRLAAFFGCDAMRCDARRTSRLVGPAAAIWSLRRRAGEAVLEGGECPKRKIEAQGQKKKGCGRWREMGRYCVESRCGDDALFFPRSRPFNVLGGTVSPWPTSGGNRVGFLGAHQGRFPCGHNRWALGWGHLATSRSNFGKISTAVR